jgi:GrpB-like predicted nucleotidyltransferase (UPF0157 family)
MRSDGPNGTEPVIIVDHDPLWAVAYLQLRDNLAKALGGLASTIEHVGSTSVPGLAAKPIIDIDVVLQSELDVPRAIRLLSAVGYRHQGDLGIPGREAFESPSGLQAHHLYLVVQGNGELRKHIAFREYLRTHPEAREGYANLKRALSVKYRNDRVAYSEGKTGFILEVLGKATVEDGRAASTPAGRKTKRNRGKGPE